MCEGWPLRIRSCLGTIFIRDFVYPLFQFTGSKDNDFTQFRSPHKQYTGQYCRAYKNRKVSVENKLILWTSTYIIIYLSNAINLSIEKCRQTPVHTTHMVTGTIANEHMIVQSGSTVN